MSGSKSSSTIIILAIGLTLIMRFEQCSTFCATELTPEQAVHLGAQLPTLVRGIYYEGWRLAGKPTNERQPDEFAKRVAAQLPPQFPRDAVSITRAVFDLLGSELDRGETEKVIRELPVPLRALWPDLTRPSTEQL